MNISIANRLLELRKKNNYSQEELADKLGISRQSISKWERAEASPDTDNLIELAKIYGITLDELLNTEVDIEEVKAKSKSKDDSKSLSTKVKEFFKDDEDEDEDENNNPRKNPKTKMDVFKAVTLSCLWAAVITIYVVLGFFPSLYFNFASGWVILLLPIVIESIFRCFEHKKISPFNMPILIVMIYCYLGIGFGLWHPYWALFIAIPVFYAVVEPIEKYRNKTTK